MSLNEGQARVRWGKRTYVLSPVRVRVRLSVRVRIREDESTYVLSPVLRL